MKINMSHLHMTQILVILVSLLQIGSLQNVKENQVEDDSNPLGDIAAEIFRSQNMQHAGSVVNNLLQSGGGKEIGDMLMGMVANGNAGNIISGLSSMMNTDKKGEIDTSVIETFLSFVSTQGSGSERSKRQDVDVGGVISMIGGFLGQVNGGNSLLSNLPLLMQTFNDFVGPEAEAREAAHKDHDSMLPPVLEKIHVLFDHFVNSEMGRKIISTLGAEKFVKIFSDENGNFSYEKFVELMENRSFRRHWITMVTDRIGSYISYMSDPVLRKKYITSGQFIINSYLEQRGFPEKAMLDAKRPVESISALVEYIASLLDTEIDAKHYVKPAVAYVQDVIRLADSKGYLSGVNSRELSNKLADTLNLEIIEPISRVNRAYKFAKKVPKCDRYVLCLVNQNLDGESDTLPGLKRLLYRSASYVAGWFLSGNSGTPFWSLYDIISTENNCKRLSRADKFLCANIINNLLNFHHEEMKTVSEPANSDIGTHANSATQWYYEFLPFLFDKESSSKPKTDFKESSSQVFYKEACNGFHIEELKVTTEYVHNEL